MEMNGNKLVAKNVRLPLSKRIELYYLLVKKWRVSWESNSDFRNCEKEEQKQLRIESPMNIRQKEFNTGALRASVGRLCDVLISCGISASRSDSRREVGDGFHWSVGFGNGSRFLFFSLCVFPPAFLFTICVKYHNNSPNKIQYISLLLKLVSFYHKEQQILQSDKIRWI